MIMPQSNTFLPDDPPTPWPDLMTEPELILYLRIPEISSARDHHNVIEHLKRMHGLPRIHICGKVLYPLKAVQKWVEEQTTGGR